MANFEHTSVVTMVILYVFLVVLGLTIASPPVGNTTEQVEIPYRRFNFTRRRVRFPILPPKLRTVPTTSFQSSTDLLLKRTGLSNLRSSRNISVMVAPIPNSHITSEIPSPLESLETTKPLNLTTSLPNNATHFKRSHRPRSSKRRGFGSVVKLMKEASSQNVVVLWTNRNGLEKTPQEDQKPTVTTMLTSQTFATISPSLATTLADDNASSHLVWPVSRKQVSRRMWTTSIATTSSTPLPKLLLPKPTRPAIYSLDGFIPTPSMAHLTTTPPTRVEIRLLASSSRRREAIELSKNQKKSSRRFSVVMRRKAVPGRDYPIYNHVPATAFRCGHKNGMYADPQTGCQAWHMCPGGGKPHRYSFLCPHGTIFSQRRSICDWWYKVECNAKLLLL